MTRQNATQTQQQTSTTSLLSRGSILQRKCESCGQHTIAGGKCEACKKSKTLPHPTEDQAPLPTLNWFSDTNGMDFEASHSVQDFSHVPITARASKPIQTKLNVSQPGDQYEQEADHVAEQVMRMPEPALTKEPQVQRSPLSGFSFGKLAITPKERLGIQTRLAIGQPGDRYEREANRVAEQVMRMPDPKGIAQNITKWEGQQTAEGWFPPTGSIQRKCSGCATEEDEAQAKLPVSKPNDPLEQEADRFAEQVMHAQTPTASRGAAPAVQRDALDDAVQQAERIDNDEEEETQPQATRPGTALAKRRGMGPQTLPVNAIPRSGGRTLEPEVQHFFSERTGLDFAHVRIHADAEAAASASRLAARAYTVGSNIYFGHGEYEPKSREGRTLLAHELAHVVQQSQGQVQPRMKAGPLSMSAAPPSVLRQLLPPGNCIQGIHDALQRAVKAWCDHPSGRACTPGESCLRLLQKIRRNQMCARNRRRINVLCYNGGDTGHRIAELDARRAQGTCMALFRAQCQPSPVPQPERQPERAPERAPKVDRGFMERMAAITGLTGTALIVYLIISEGSRIIPPRNLIPVP